ncbi:MAG: hypothetical protein II184_08785 [Clostridia bacterium]|nr:hypothetical protein [Clostridia bacterium]
MRTTGQSSKTETVNTARPARPAGIALLTLLLAASAALAISLSGCRKTQPVDPYAENGGYNINLLCGVDEFGRTFDPVLRTDSGKTVGMFYFLWHGASGTTTYNITELLKTDAKSLWNKAGNAKSPLYAFHYWNEPLFGYYRSKDKWVLARHCEMLTAAGVDFLAFDTSNGPIYVDQFMALCEVFQEYYDAGWNVPRICFMTRSKSVETMENVYNALYKDGLYKDLWYCRDGETPVILGCPTEGMEDRYAELDEFFDIIYTQWPSENVIADALPWIEWSYPQPIHNGTISVSICQHTAIPMSRSWTQRNMNWGRGYDHNDDYNHGESFREGINFQQQWDTVFKNIDKIDTVFVTGWNEWIAQKLIVDGVVGFVDQFNEEFSRDIEMPKEGYGDNFYLQLCDNIRRFKGVSGVSPVSPKQISIDVKGDPGQWDQVSASYKALSQTVRSRNDLSVDGKTRYKQEAPANNIRELKVAHDKTNLYFLICCENDVVLSDDASWMNIYIGTGALKAAGFCGYEYMADCTPEGGQLLKLNESGTGTGVGNAVTSVSGRFVQVAIPLKALGISKLSDCRGVYFKVTDGVKDADNILNTYLSGKSLPMGRLSYYYFF